jgi:hypothetical protein
MKLLVLLISVVKKILPAKIRLFLTRKIKTPVQQYQYKLQQKRYSKIIENIKKKDKITVAFFLIHDSVWKLEGVYRLMEKDNRFYPVVIVCPYIIYGYDNMLKTMQTAYNSFVKENYNAVKTYNEKTNEWLDVKKMIKPDIVFFTNPHKLTRNEYYITNYLDRLTCYVPYNIGSGNLMKMMYNQLFHNLLWKLFAETEIHKQFSIDNAVNKGVNVVVSGYPGTDVFLNTGYVPKNVWKGTHDNLKKKKIIWAPHHTIDDDKQFLSFSSFLIYSDYMINLAKKYKDCVQFTFKPHPLLKPRLYLHTEWGKEKTDNYYNLWNEMENGQLEECDYVDLFLTSDAMIHDSGSFLTEYLYVDKPVLRTDRYDSITDRLNEFGVMAYKMHYHARTEKDIERFVKNVIEGKDEMRKKREDFKQQYLLPPNHQSASQNIINIINKQID